MRSTQHRAQSTTNIQTTVLLLVTQYWQLTVIRGSHNAVFISTQKRIIVRTRTPSAVLICLSSAALSPASH